MADANHGFNFRLEPCFQLNSSFMSRIFFIWTHKLIQKGNQTHLEMEDLSDLREDQQPKYSAEKIKDVYNIYNKEQPQRLFKSLKKILSGSIIITGILVTISSLLQFSEPLVIGKILTILNEERENTLKEGYFYVSILIICYFMRAYLFQHAMHYNNLSLIKTANSINFLIFNKITKLSSSSRKYLEAGSIMNNVNVDVNSIQQMVMMIYRFFNDPVTILVSMAMLVFEVGWIGLISPIVCFVCMGLQQKIMKLSMDMRKDQLIFSDQRSKCISEYFSGIKIIKYYGWEQIVQTKIQQIRNKQLNLNFKVLMLRSYVQILLNMIPIISSIIIFTAFVAINGEEQLTPSKVYTVLAIFNMLAFPMRLIMVAFISYIDGTTSLKRIQHFLNYQERKIEGINVDDQLLSIGEIKIKQCKFNWETVQAKQHFSKGQQISTSSKKERKDEKNMKNKKGVFKINNVPGKKMKKKKDKKKKKKKKKNDNSMNENLLCSESEFQNKLDKEQFNLSIQHLVVNSGQFISIIGKVGSGKSTFLSAILGEVQKISGSLSRRGRIAYISQTAWLRNATIKENILFQEVYEEKKYNKILQICQLLPDLQLLEGKDKTEIGENGVNLSGGQKQRIAIARAIYSNADIYIIDDCLSALDAYVGKNIFMNVLKKQLHEKRKTILFVTNSIQYTEGCDRVIILEKGQIIQNGVPQILLAKQESKYRNMREEKKGKQYMLQPKEQVKISKHIQEIQEIFQGQQKFEEIGKQNEPVENNQNERDQKFMKKPTSLIKGEQRLKGSVPWKFYFRFFTGPGKFATFLMFLFVCLTQISRVMSDWWLGQWSTHQLDISFSAYIWIYSIISASVGILLLLKGIFFGKFIIHTSRVIQRQLIKVLLKSPLGWFDVTPTGRILARTTKDQDDLDNSLSFNVQYSTQNLLILLSSILLIAIATPIYLIIAIISGIAYSKLSKMYMNASREIKRLSALRRAPLISHFQQVITGIYTIRAFQKEKAFNQKYFIRQKDYIVPNVNQNITSRWISLVTDMFSILTIAAAGYLGIASVIFQLGSATPNMIGLALVWSLNMNMIMSFTLRILADTQSNMNAVVRLYDYIDHNPAQKDFNHPLPNKSSWPSQGIFQIRKISYKYRNQLPLVIKSISFDINQNAKIGVVGRTGSGKSTLTLGLLRILQLAQNDDGSRGQIILDEENIANVGLYHLRHNISIIPQDPILFSGTIKSNLDPNDEYEDNELVQCLKKVQIWDQIKQNQQFENKIKRKLYKQVDESGTNFSQGQKQLICLTRALIRKPKILLMDQATASIDEQTDQIIQKMIRKQFTKTTVITIAHRLNTLAHYDKILVLNQGEIQQYDTPNKLINNPNSFLGKVIRKVGKKYFQRLVKLTQI